MTISERINKKFNSHGTTIEESIKNAKVGGGSAGYSVVTEEVEEVFVDSAGQKTNWSYISDADASMLELASENIDLSIDTLTITLDGETKTLHKAPDGFPSWVYPEGSEPSPDIVVSNSGPNAVTIACKGNVSYDSVIISSLVSKETITVEDDFKKAVRVADSVLVVHATYNEDIETSVLDKTWQEIYNAYQNGLVILFYMDEDNPTVVTEQHFVYFVGQSGVAYEVATMEYNGGDIDYFYADSPTDKPDLRTI